MDTPQPTVPAPEPTTPAPRWGLGDAIAGLATSIGFSTIATLLLVAFGADDVLEVVPVVVTIAAGWTGLLLWAARASYVKGARSFTDDFGWGSQRLDWLRGIGAGIAALVVVGVFSALVSDDVGDPTFAAVDPSGSFEVVLLGLTIVVGAPIVEELFFRGLFLRAVARRAGDVAAVLVTSTVFALLHVPQRESLGFVQAFVPLFVLGVALGWLAARYRRLGPSVAAHMTINGLGFLGLLSSSPS